MTIRDFLELCTMVGEPVALYNFSTEEMTIGEVGEPNMFETISIEVLNAELVSWDYAECAEYEEGRVICLNYEI